MIKAHVTGLANQKRVEKKDALYQYIASDKYRQKTAETTRLASELENLDIAETQEHRRTWEKRGRSIKQQLHALRDYPDCRTQCHAASQRHGSYVAARQLRVILDFLTRGEGRA